MVRRDRPQGVRGAIGRALRRRALDDVGERRVDVVGAPALDAVHAPHDRPGARVDRRSVVVRNEGRIGVFNPVRRRAGAGLRLGGDAARRVVGVGRHAPRLLGPRADVLAPGPREDVGPGGRARHAAEALHAVRARKAPGGPRIGVHRLREERAVGGVVAAADPRPVLVRLFALLHRPDAGWRRKRPFPARVVKDVPLGRGALVERRDEPPPLPLPPDGERADGRGVRHGVEPGRGIDLRRRREGPHAHVVAIREGRDVREARGRHDLPDAVRVAHDVEPEVGAREDAPAHVPERDELSALPGRVGGEEAPHVAVADVQIPVDGRVRDGPPLGVHHHEAFGAARRDARGGRGDAFARREGKAQGLALGEAEVDLARRAVGEVRVPHPLVGVVERDVERLGREEHRRGLHLEDLERERAGVRPRRRPPQPERQEYAAGLGGLARAAVGGASAVGIRLGTLLGEILLCLLRAAGERSHRHGCDGQANQDVLHVPTPRSCR